MSNFKILFAHPWLLLLLIPIVAIVLFAYFRVSKKYRRNRNRVTSMVLGLIAAVCAVGLTAGVSFSYDEKNRDNELIVVVDASYSNEQQQRAKQSYIQNLFNNTQNIAKVGVVAFGRDAVYAAELTENAPQAYEAYLAAEQPKDDATNIAAALSFAHSRLSNPKAGKLLLISDGIETDGDALTQVSKIAAEGVSVDVLQFPNGDYGKEVQLVQVKMPEQTVIVGENVQLEVVVQSSVAGDAYISMEENGETVDSADVILSKGMQSVYFKHAFAEKGLHKLSFSVAASQDSEVKNNTVESYVYIEVFDKILILERGGESAHLQEIADVKYKADVKNIADAPKTLSALRQYDQVVLNNISNADFPKGFDRLLDEYVRQFGGGLFTVGGTRQESGQTVPNLYTYDDLHGSLYQKMLPVEAMEEYTPPIAVMLIMDTSGSMGGEVKPGLSRMEEAKQSALESLKSLNDRDYVGVIKFDSTYEYLLAPTPMTQKTKITQTIKNIHVNNLGGTVLPGGLEQAGRVLSSFTGVNKKHILVVTDGDTTELEKCVNSATHYYNNYEITTSIVDYNINNVNMDRLAEAGHGHHYVADNGEQLIAELRRDLTNPEIREYEMKPSQPSFGLYSSAFAGINEEEIPKVTGFFGTKVKNKAKQLIVGEFGEPLYAQWEYGKGKVGSFMCDLNGVMTEDFLANDVGKEIVNRIFGALFPVENVKDTGVDTKITVDNLSASVNISTVAQEGEWMQVTVRGPKFDDTGHNIVAEFALKDFAGNETVSFEFSDAGVYEIEVRKMSVDDQAIAGKLLFCEFSYSQEYNPFLNGSQNAQFMEEVARRGGGQVVSSVNDVFSDFVPYFYRTYNPYIWLAAVALIAMLAEVAVRKFKFRWPHEIIRDAVQKHKSEKDR